MMFMRNAVVVGIASGLLLCAGSAFADADLFRKSNCMACHAVDQKRFGPSLKDVAAKYSGDSKAEAMLAKKIQTGGAGVWGQVPMPAQPQVNDADAKALAAYILSIK
jgi:cytochrome c